MEKRPFQDKRSPSKNTGNQKQRFKPPLFINDEKEPTSPGQQPAQLHDSPVGGKIRAPRSTERPRSRKSESSITGADLLQDENPFLSNTKGMAKSLPETVQVHAQGKLIQCKGISGYLCYKYREYLISKL